MKIARKFTNFTVALILALSLGAGVAYALDSDWWNTPYINGIMYTQCSGIDVNSSTKVAIASAWARPVNKAAPTGYVGTRAVLCYSNGNAYASNGWYYTKSSTALGKWVSSAYRAMNCRVGSIWCGWGQTDHWYGNGYTRYNTWYTPNQRV